MQSHGHAGRVEFANSLRGLACLMVVVSHYCGMYWQYPDIVASLTGIPKPAQVAAEPFCCQLINVIPNLSLGLLGVAVFFLISGFVIPYSLSRQNSWQFTITRTLRIWPTYAAGFAITVLTIMAGCAAMAGSLPFSAKEAAIHFVPGIRDLLTSKNIDGIVWTLEIEVKFYALCALTAFWMRKRAMQTFLVPFVLGGLALYLSTRVPGWNVPHPKRAIFTATCINLVQFLIYMYIGVAFHYMYVGALKAEKAVMLMAALFGMSCIVWANSPYAGPTKIIWNYGLAVVLFAFAMSYPRIFGANRITDFLADISYPLYVIHGVAGYVVLRSLQERGWTPLPAIGLTTLLAISVSWLVHKLVEAPSQRFGKWLVSSKPKGNQEVQPRDTAADAAPLARGAA